MLTGMDNNTRRKLLTLSPSAIVELLHAANGKHTEDGFTLKIHGLPSDARGICAGLTDSGSINVIVESKSFPEVEDGYVFDSLCLKAYCVSTNES